MSNDKHGCDDDSQGTDYHLDFLDRIGQELERNPLTVEQQRSATVLQSRSKLRENRTREMGKPTLALKKSANSLRIAKAPKPRMANLGKTHKSRDRHSIGSHQPASTQRYNMAYNNQLNDRLRNTISQLGMLDQTAD